MANAKKCDVCGAYFSIHETRSGKLIDYSYMNSIKIMQRDYQNKRVDDINTIDCCPKCMEKVLDILNIKKKNDNDEDDKTKVEEHCLTCRELLAIHNPSASISYELGGCKSCPSSYGYLYSHEELCTVNDEPDDELCTKCWDQIATKYYDEKGVKNNEQN